MSRARHLIALLTLSLSVLLFAAPALADEGRDNEPPPQSKDSLTAVLTFLETWRGDPALLMSFLERQFTSPEELQAVYDLLPTEIQAEIEGMLETESFEGGLGLGGGARFGLGDGVNTGGVFRLSLSGGTVWAFGDFSMPIYYAFPDIPGPWALGYQVFIHTDNFTSVTAGATLRWAHDFLGWTPYAELGPALNFDFDGDLAPVAHIELGYGSVIAQGFVQTDIAITDGLPTTVIVGVRAPWLLFTLL